MSRIKLLIFDVGDTLIDIFSLAQSVDKKLLKKLYNVELTNTGLAEIMDRISLELVKKRYYPLPNMFTKILLQTVLKTTDISEKDVQRYDHEWYKTNWKEVKLFPDAISVLKVLRKKYFLATLSNTHDTVLHTKILRNTKVHPHFHVHFDSDMMGFRKPHPKAFLRVLKHFTVEPSETVMIGDLPLADILGANRLGINTVLLNRRKLPYSLRGSIKPDFEINSLRQLSSVLKKLENKSQ